MSQLEKKLKVIHKLSRLIPDPRREALINFLSYKTDKIQLVFENISNAHNIVILNAYFNLGSHANL